MFKLKTVLTAAMCVLAMTVSADTVDGLTVSSADGQHQFAISEIKEIKFADDGMTVVKTDGATSTFTPRWQMKFGLVDMSGVEDVNEITLDTPARVYTVEGRLIGSFARLSDLQPESLAPGTYVIISNGKTFKIQR